MPEDENSSKRGKKKDTGESPGGQDPKPEQANEVEMAGDEEDKKEENKNKTLADEMKEAVYQQKEENKSDGEDLTFFERKEKDEQYSIWNLDYWLQDTLKHMNAIIRLLIEVIIVSAIFIGPSAMWLYSEWGSIDFLKFFQTPGTLSYDSESVFRLGLFVVIWYTLDCIVGLICENIIMLMSGILSCLQLDESEFIWSLVDNFYNAREYFRLCVVFLSVFMLSNLMFDEYHTPVRSYNILDPMVIRALVLWYGIYTGMMFLMKFLINIFIYDIKKSSHSDMIMDLNNKLFIIKKLKAISEAWSPTEYHDICDSMMPSYDPGFYLKDRDFFSSKEDAEVVAQNIMALLKKKALTYSDIKEYFPSNHERVFKYLSNTDPIQQKQTVTVSALKTLAKELYMKRADMDRTLKDRNYIFEKLEMIFSLFVKYISAIVLCAIFEIDYKIYIASFGTSILTFSWVFADSIKKLFNCFVFVLIIRPYDIGDKVRINDENYVVNKINLLTTTFLTSLKKLTYIPNDVLIATKIYNVARSPPQSLIIELTVDEGTTYEQGKALVDIVKNDIKKAKKYFVDLEFQKMVDGKLCYIVYTTQNFQNFDAAASRQNRLIKIFESGLGKAKITYKNSFNFID